MLSSHTIRGDVNFILYTRTFIMHKRIRTAEIAQKAVFGYQSQLRTLPAISHNLHQRSLLEGESNLFLPEEADILEVVDHPAEMLAATMYLDQPENYFSLSRLGSQRTR